MPPAESEAYELKHPIHSLGAEEFELLIALIYQRQGYRISMPAGLGSGRGGDFTLLRKGERVLVQCKRMDLVHKMPVEKVQELYEAMATQNVKRGIYVASCGFSWDARNFAKTKGITVINARTLDELITAAQETPKEDLLAVPEWAPKLMSKVQLTAPQCPACDAPMDQITTSSGTTWVCSQRPDCRGRRVARKYQKAAQAPAEKAGSTADGATKQTLTSSRGNGAKQTLTESLENGAKQAMAAIKRNGVKQSAVSKDTKKAVAPSQEESVRNAIAASATDRAKPSSRIKLVDKIEHSDPVRQAELKQLAEMARKALQARRAAQGKAEEEPAVPVVQVSQAVPATSRKPAAPERQVRQVVQATPGNRPAPETPARKVIPGTPGNRPTANQARR
jgi:ssDNA-binding Zn-finger/Zn-ribbon topoisomerase 1